MTHTALTVLTVGQPYLPGRRTWPQRADLSMSAGGLLLRVFVSSPTESEVLAARTGKARFAWVDGGATAVLCFALTLPDGSGLPWWDQPYHAHREPSPQAGPPGVLGQPLVVTILFIDADNGLLKAIRVLGGPARAGDHIRRTVQRQAQTPHEPDVQDHAIQTLYARYPTSAALSRSPMATTWTGGT